MRTKKVHLAFVLLTSTLTLGACAGPTNYDSYYELSPTVGCVTGLGYIIDSKTVACRTPLAPLVAADLASACAPGWALCTAPPAGGCAGLPVFAAGAVVGFTKAQAYPTCGGSAERPQGATEVVYGCGALFGAVGTLPEPCGNWWLYGPAARARGLCCRG